MNLANDAAGPEIIQLPATLYVVGLVYFHRRRAEHRLIIATLTVSGYDPLTPGEAVTRVRTRAESDWAALDVGPLGDWELTTSTAVAKPLVPRGWHADASSAQRET